MPETEVKRKYGYFLSHPSDNVPMYIGVTSDPAKRLKQHCRESTYSRNLHRPVYKWINSLAEQNLKPSIHIIASCIDDDWSPLEIRLIAQYREDYELLNVADGGNQPKASHEANVRNAKALSIKRAEKFASDPFSKLVWSMKKQMRFHLRHIHEFSPEIAKSIKQKLRYAAEKRPDLFGEYRSL